MHHVQVDLFQIKEVQNKLSTTRGAAEFGWYN